MINRRLATIVFTMGLAASGCAAQDRPDVGEVSDAICNLGSPNATVSVPANGTYSNTSADGSYYTNICGAYLVRFVPSREGSADFNVDEVAAYGEALPSTSSSCPNAHVSLFSEYDFDFTDLDFKGVGYTQLHGFWTGSTCVLAYDPGYAALPTLLSQRVVIVQVRAYFGSQFTSGIKARAKVVASNWKPAPPK